ncbi:MAG TPA: serine hydrolase domain-containing protein [Caulobacteraceae bacterium]|jgi:CubicO group peptidase (beta-lactamase class C family)|nr:serine hydrolase domain-containing protein [Caulobacteraceae bacterium]
MFRRPPSIKTLLKLAGGALAGIALLASPSAGQPLGPTPPSPQPAAPPAPVATPGHAMTADDVGAWLDGFMPNALNTAEAPGAVVVVVKDGQVLFEKGYGYADYDKRIPVDPKVTLFRPGSTSKLFTWTAVMQQVEAGKIDLDADVNTYLDFKIPAYHGVPVTMRQLMTHRAGFSETARDLLTFGKAPPPLDQVLKRYVPPRIFLPDGGPGYSNYGAALAGYIVQRVSGEEFDAYVARHIFSPLDMQHATFAQPLPAAFVPDMSKGYETRNKPGPGFEIIDMPPAGALSATGDDMSHFMIAQLQLGRYGSGQILKPQTATEMHTTLTKAFPDLNGNALGFYEQNINGHRVIAHGGDTDYFHTDLALFIDDNVGLYVSVNAKGKEGMGEFLRQNLFEGFADRYFPAPPAPVQHVDTATAKAHAAMIAGSYINTRRSDSTFLALIQLIGQAKIAANPDGSISAAPLGQVETFDEVKPFLWQQRNGHDRIEGIVQDGRVVRWSSDTAAPIFVYVRPTGLAGTGLELPLAMAALVLLLLTAVLWPIIAIVRWRYRQPFALTGARAMAYRLVRLCAALGVAAVVMWYVVIELVSSTGGAPVEPLIHLSQLLSLLAFAGGFIVAVWNLVLVFTRQASWFARLYGVLLTAAFGMMLWIALHYHLIGVSGQY